MSTVKEWKNETSGQAAAKALNANGFDAHYVKTGKEAIEIVKKYLVKDKTVAFGGSMTIEALGIKEIAVESGCIILDHNNPKLSPEEKKEIRKRQLISDVFISSSNAITLEGEIVNVDGNGNRVAALTFGPDKTIVVVGINKIVQTTDDAFSRIELFASPMNAKRLSRATPCAKTGVCMDCDSPERLCRAYQILRKKPFSADFTVIIVGEELGY